MNKANTIDGSGFDVGQTSVAGSSAPASIDDDGIYAAIDMQKYGSATGGGRAQGMGNVFSAQGVPNNVFIRGGGSHHGSHIGVFTLALHYTASAYNTTFGFRCAR